MILCHDEIIRNYLDDKIHISPFNADMVGPNSVDVHLWEKIIEVVENDNFETVDVDKPQRTVGVHRNGDGSYILHPGRLYLGSTVEEIGSDHFVPMLEGRSSIGRMGLFVHITAGFGDIGFKKQWTLELTPVLPMRIYPGMRIAQVFFHQASSRTKLYDGRYKDQSDPTPSLYSKVIEKR